MIKSFQHKGLRRYFIDDDGRLLNPNQTKRIKRLLDALDSADTVKDLDYSGNNLHELKGDRKGTWSLSVSGNWRITFRFEDGNAHDIDLEDYY